MVRKKKKIVTKSIDTMKQMNVCSHTVYTQIVAVDLIQYEIYHVKWQTVYKQKQCATPISNLMAVYIEYDL